VGSPVPSTQAVVLVARDHGRAGALTLLRRLRKARIGLATTFLILVALTVLTAALVAGLTGAANLSRSHARQVSVP
jgi:hypothetical protein